MFSIVLPRVPVQVHSEVPLFQEPVLGPVDEAGLVVLLQLAEIALPALAVLAAHGLLALRHDLRPRPVCPLQPEQGAQQPSDVPEDASL